jgi:preprotein translocase subunit SecG
MENVVLIIHLLLAIFLIAVVLLQRSEGGALGIGGGGGGLVSARGAATALSKLTWALAIGFICTSITLAILAGGGGAPSVFDDAGPVDRGAIPLPTLPGGNEVPLQGGGELPSQSGSTNEIPLPAPAPAE